MGQIAKAVRHALLPWTAAATGDATFELLVACFFVSLIVLRALVVRCTRSRASTIASELQKRPTVVPVMLHSLVCTVTAAAVLLAPSEPRVLHAWRRGLLPFSTAATVRKHGTLSASRATRRARRPPTPRRAPPLSRPPLATRLSVARRASRAFPRQTPPPTAPSRRALRPHLLLLPEGGLVGGRASPGGARVQLSGRRPCGRCARGRAPTATPSTPLSLPPPGTFLQATLLRARGSLVAGMYTPVAMTRGVRPHALLVQLRPSAPSTRRATPSGGRPTATCSRRPPSCSIHVGCSRTR